MLSLPFVSGASVGGSLIVAIGAQNAFVLRQGLLRQHVFVVVLICMLSDVLMISAGVGGLGAFVQTYPSVVRVIKYAGVAYLLYFGLCSLYRAFGVGPQVLMASTDHASQSLQKVVLTTLMLTYLNPHLYLDTIVLMGSIGAQYTGPDRFYFGLGAISASIIWFILLGYSAQFLAPLLRQPRSWQIFDGIMGTMIICLAISLVYAS